MPPHAPKLSGILTKLLAAYIYWHSVTRHIPKMRRYSVGVKIDLLFADLIELISTAQFSNQENRPAIISQAITKNDVLKFMLYVLLELKGIEEQYFLNISLQIEEIGRMLYGWKNKILSENHSDKRSGNK